MDSKSKLIAIGGAAIASIATWWIYSARKSKPDRDSIPSSSMASSDPSKLQYCGNIDWRSKLKQISEDYPQGTAESWFLAYRPTNPGLNIVVYGNPYYWTVFYSNSWIKFDLFTNFNRPEDVFCRGPDLENSVPLLLPAGVPINFYIYNSGKAPLYTFQLRNAATDEELSQNYYLAPSISSQFNIRFDEEGQIVYSKTLIELREADSVRQEMQLENPVPPFVQVPGLGAIRILDSYDPSHEEAIDGARRLGSVIVMSATFRVVSVDHFEQWTRQNQMKRLDAL